MIMILVCWNSSRGKVTVEYWLDFWCWNLWQAFKPRIQPWVKVIPFPDCMHNFGDVKYHNRPTSLPCKIFQGGDTVLPWPLPWIVTFVYHNTWRTPDNSICCPDVSPNQILAKVSFVTQPQVFHFPCCYYSIPDVILQTRICYLPCVIFHVRD